MYKVMGISIQAFLYRVLFDVGRLALGAPIKYFTETHFSGTIEVVA